MRPFEANMAGSLVPHRRSPGDMDSGQNENVWRRCLCRYGTGDDVALISRKCVPVRFLWNSSFFFSWIDISTSII